MDCGPTCLKMVAQYYGKRIALHTLRDKCFMTSTGISLLGLRLAAESVGFKTSAVRVSFEQLLSDVRLPCIVHWKQNHFVVVYCVKEKSGGQNRIYVADPAHGRIAYNRQEFLSSWCVRGDENGTCGICMILEPLPSFFNRVDEHDSKLVSLRLIVQYLEPHLSYELQILFAALAAGLIAFVVPFFTRVMVDNGLTGKDLSLITTILLAQIALSMGQTAVEFIRGWVSVYLSSRAHLVISADFLGRFMRLPLSFFEHRITGDMIQRMDDIHRIQEFMTSSVLNALFASGMAVVLFVVMACWDFKICMVYLGFSLLYLVWAFLFLQRRKSMDHRRFALSSANRTTLIQLMSGMSDIKLTQSETLRRWEWERGQVEWFILGLNGLKINQYQNSGAALISSVRNIVITYMTVVAGLKGMMTWGMMLSVQYIIGQLNGPLNSVVRCIQQGGDVHLSLERMEEVLSQPTEDDLCQSCENEMPSSHTIRIMDVSFQYEGPCTAHALKHLNLQIPEKQVTAIVGSSGSGKTTLLKLLMGCYDKYQGTIMIGNVSLGMLHPHTWRRHVGAVMQDGQIYYDTIESNITLEIPADQKRLSHAVDVAHIHDEIRVLPHGFKTLIGKSGHGLSQGQRQRILLARVVYHNPDFVFLDEATNALDACTEHIVMNNLKSFFTGRTVVLVAHRLSTIRQAQNIVVLDRGMLVEQGTHESLLCQKGVYYRLVSHQLQNGLL